MLVMAAGPPGKAGRLVPGSVQGRRADSVTAAADELYGLPLGEFTAARAERAKQARADGDRGAAAAIGRLPKPSVVAWLANQLARQYPGEVAPLLELGEDLRRATADLDAARLRELSRQQQQVVAALMSRVRELAAAAGQAVSDSTERGLEDTLHAALADEAAGRQLTAGQLASGLSRTGFPGLDGADQDGDATIAARSAPAAPTRSRAAPATKADGTGQPSSRTGAGRPRSRGGTAQDASAGSKSRAAEADRRAQAARAAAEARQQQRERARRAEDDARGYAGEASRDQDRARAALAEADRAAGQAEETVTRLQDELDAALEARTSAGRAQRQAKKEAERADRVARQAGRRLAEATARRQDLDRES
jgi:hypothetical protein